MSFNRDDKKRYYGKKTDRGSFGAGRKPFRGDFDKKSTPYNDTDAAKEELSGWKSTGSNLDDNTQKIAPVDLMENIESAESIKQNYLFGLVVFQNAVGPQSFSNFHPMSTQYPLQFCQLLITKHYHILFLLFPCICQKLIQSGVLISF